MKEICPIWEKLLLETIKVNQVVQKQIIAKRKEKQMAEFFRRVEKKYILTKKAPEKAQESYKEFYKLMDR